MFTETTQHLSFPIHTTTLPTTYKKRAEKGSTEISTRSLGIDVSFLGECGAPALASVGDLVGSGSGPLLVYLPLCHARAQPDYDSLNSTLAALNALATRDSRLVARDFVVHMAFVVYVPLVALDTLMNGSRFPVTLLVQHIAVVSTLLYSVSYSASRARGGKGVVDMSFPVTSEASVSAQSLVVNGRVWSCVGVESCFEFVRRVRASSAPFDRLQSIAARFLPQLALRITLDRALLLPTGLVWTGTQWTGTLAAKPTSVHILQVYNKLESRAANVKLTAFHMAGAKARTSGATDSGRHNEVNTSAMGADVP
ncbi:hypothetical protein FIBSPDRAFT_904903 [Athelia psychrophila]|uniref:Uncharacterized protein n=1 Tax=Athelia psychrophila TaxID=1759441 RepID=A0A167U577_9AGAM|nr:hypothetical protein FIBSPDRAFT_904903 [Fibularhizoctonia sp. CBS 109695]